MLYGYFYWWYGAGFVQSYQVAVALLYQTADFFSVESLVATWLAPWKNDVLSASNVALSDQVKIWEQNFASRLIGFLLRTIVILVAIVSLGVLAILSVLALSVWLLVPILIGALPVAAVWMVTQ